MLIPRISFLFCSVVSFIIILLSVADVSVIAITVSTDKISNHSKTNINGIMQVHNKTARRGSSQTVTPDFRG